MASDEEVVAKQDEVAALRKKLADLRLGKGAQYLQEQTNDITVAQLEAEKATLQAAVTEAEHNAKRSTVASGAAAPLASAQDAMARAVHHQKATADAVAGTSTQSSGSRRSSRTPVGGDATSGKGE